MTFLVTPFSVTNFSALLDLKGDDDLNEITAAALV
jgi:hypothetical protein